jgi:hypothetical protein
MTRRRILVCGASRTALGQIEGVDPPRDDASARCFALRCEGKRPARRKAEEIVHDCRVGLARIKRNQLHFRREIEQARRGIETSVDLLRRIGAELSRFDDAVNQPRPRR